MRILHVVHSFPPQGVGGTEHYVQHLASAQLAAGHEVGVLYPLLLPGGSRSRLIEDRYPLGPNAGLRLFKITNPNRDTLYWTAFNAEAERAALDAVKRFAPDVLHIHHLYWLSCRIPRAVKREHPGCRIVMTLHDYWYACYKGTLRRPWGELCSGPDRLKCMGCIEQRGLLAAGFRPLAAMGPVLWPFKRISALKAAETLERIPGESGLRLQTANAWFFLHREEEMRAMLREADVLLAPSRWLQEFYGKWLLRMDIRHVPHGIHAVSRTGSHEGMRFCYIGQFAPHKGADHMLRAFRLAALQRMAKGEAVPELRLYGPAPNPTYMRQLHALAAERDPLLIDKISFEGRFEARELSRVLSDIDVLVVPSRWPENAPLAVLEALSVGLPVIAPRLGGLPELLDPDGAAPSSGLSRVPGGWLYGQRDTLPEDSELAEALLTSGHPATSSVEVPDMEKHAALVERVYRTALRERRGKKDANEAVS